MGNLQRKNVLTLLTVIFKIIFISILLLGRGGPVSPDAWVIPFAFPLIHRVSPDNFPSKVECSLLFLALYFSITSNQVHLRFSLPSTQTQQCCCWPVGLFHVDEALASLRPFTTIYAQLFFSSHSGNYSIIS